MYSHLEDVSRSSDRFILLSSVHWRVTECVGGGGFVCYYCDVKASEFSWEVYENGLELYRKSLQVALRRVVDCMIWTDYISVQKRFIVQRYLLDVTLRLIHR